MRLLLKFNLIFCFTFALGLAITAYMAEKLLHESAQTQVLGQAKLMMETAMASRAFTSKHIAPLLKNQRSQISDVLNKYQQNLQIMAATPNVTPVQDLTPAQQAEVAEAFKSALAQQQLEAANSINSLPRDPNDVFYAETVPAYAATETFNFLHNKYPEYVYKEATLNPTNPRDRANDWEADVVNTFRNDPSKTVLSGRRILEGVGESLYLAQPIKIAAASCLECHSTPDKAPAAMIKLYGSDNGFNWQLNDIVGAQIIQVPVAVPERLANDAFHTLLYSLIGVFVLILVILNVALYFAIIRPVAQLSALADAVSQGALNQPEVPIRGKDEISILANSFNRMRRSLVKAIELLDQ